jgi:hypothetical protein
LKIKYLLLLTVFCTLLPAQNLFPILGGQRAGTSVFTFLNIGVSPRAEGMGEAVVALHQNASSVYYNPATIAQFNQTEITLSRVQWHSGIHYDYGAYTTSFKKQFYLGVSAGILHMNPMRETTEYNPHGTGNYFTFQDRFIGLTYGVKMTDRFSFGVTLKHVSEHLAGHIMSSSMVDLGTYYWTGYKTLRFSASLSHFGPQTNPNGSFVKRILDTETGEEIEIESNFELFSPPTIFRVGTALDILSSKKEDLIISIQLNHPVDNAETISLGAEYSLNQTLFLRGGRQLNKEEVNYSVGFGVRTLVNEFEWEFDYAYTQKKHLTSPNRFSVSLSF